MDKIKIDKLHISNKYNNFFMISDIHLGLKNGSEEWIENMKDYFENFFIPLINKNKDKYSFLIVLGDIFDDRKNINIMVNDLAINIFEKLGSIIPTYIINGNHDLYKKTNNNVTSLKSLENIKGVTMIKNPTMITLYWYKEIPSGPEEYTKEIEWSKKLMFIPYQGNQEIETELCNQNGNCDYMFMHTDFKNLRYDNGRNISIGVDTSRVKGHVYSGHIHLRQISDKITYVGNPYQFRRSDIGNQKGIYQIKLKKGKDKEIFYENNYSPIFQKIWLHDLLDKPYEYAKKICANNYTDILVNDEELSNLNFTKMYEALDICNPKRIEIKQIDNNNILYEDYDENVGEYKDMSIPEIIDELIDSMEISDNKKEHFKALSKKYQSLIDEIDMDGFI